jgi:ribonucleotide reductase beta subunit family protein with ferritin-like domain
MSGFDALSNSLALSRNAFSFKLSCSCRPAAYSFSIVSDECDIDKNHENFEKLENSYNRRRTLEAWIFQEIMHSVSISRALTTIHTSRLKESMIDKSNRVCILQILLSENASMTNCFNMILSSLHLYHSLMTGE